MLAGRQETRDSGVGYCAPTEWLEQQRRCIIRADRRWVLTARPGLWPAPARIPLATRARPRAADQRPLPGLNVAWVADSAPKLLPGAGVTDPGYNPSPSLSSLFPSFPSVQKRLRFHFAAACTCRLISCPRRYGSGWAVRQAVSQRLDSSSPPRRSCSSMNARPSSLAGRVPLSFFALSSS